MAIKEPMDLRTLKRKLIDGDYASLQDYKRGFRLIIDNALQWHEPDSEIAKDAQSLNAKFEDKTTVLSQTDVEDPKYDTASDSSGPASPDNGPGDEPPRRTRELRPRAAKLWIQTYRSPSLRDYTLHGRWPQSHQSGSTGRIEEHSRTRKSTSKWHLRFG